MNEDQLQEAIMRLKEIQEEQGVPKNVKARIVSTIQALEEKTETRVKVNKALNELELIAEDRNMESSTRMQIFNVVSVLEVI